MKILFYRYGSICEPDLIDAFMELGHTVTQITAEITNKQMTPKETIDLVSKSLFDTPADLVFSINFFPSLAEVCSIFKLRYFCWSVDSPVMELFSASIERPWNRVFLFDRTQYEEIHPLNPDCVFHLPLATNIKSKQEPIRSATDATKAHFAADVSFVGSLYTEKSPYDKLTGASDYLTGYLNGIMRAQQEVYGCYLIDNLLTDEIVEEFKSHLPGFYQYPGPTHLTDRITMSQLYIGNKITALERLDTFRLLSEHFSTDIYTGSDTSSMPKLHNRGFAKTLTEMPIIFHESKINLNTTSKAIRSGLPLRIFDILGSGGFVLTNYQSELFDCFTPDQDLVSYGSMEEMLEKCAYYLEHEKERAEIAQTGFETVQKYHTYTIRVEEMLRVGFSR